MAVIYLSASKPQYSEDMIKKDDFTQIAYKKQYNRRETLWRTSRLSGLFNNN